MGTCIQLYYRGTADRPIKYGIGRLTNDVIVNITVYSEVKFYPVKVKLALTTSCTSIKALYT
jgi:hypothetical protein